MASGGKWHPDVAMATVAEVVRHAREVGDEHVMSANLGLLQVVPEGRGRRRGGGGAGEGREGRRWGVSTHTVEMDQTNCRQESLGWDVNNIIILQVARVDKL